MPTGGPVVDAVWMRRLDRAGPRHLPPMTDDADVHPIVDGEGVEAVEAEGLVRVFRLARFSDSVHVASREVVPAKPGIASEPRSLVVAIRRVAIKKGKTLDPRSLIAVEFMFLGTSLPRTGYAAKEILAV